MIRADEHLQMWVLKTKNLKRNVRKEEKERIKMVSVVTVVTTGHVQSLPG